MLEIATRARVSKRELYALVGNKQEILIACFSERAKRLDLPGNLPVPRDRETLAKVLASFGTKLVREVSDPTVVAVFRLAIAEAAQAPPSGACPRFYRTRGKPRGLAAKSWPRLRRPGAHRPSCRTCRAVRRTALARFDGQPAARRRRATEPPQIRKTCPRRSSRLPATSSATEWRASYLTPQH